MARHCLSGLAAAAVIAIACFVLIGLKGNIAFVLELRLVKVAALVQVGAAIAVSTVVFQTVTGNRILTPSIMGLDALYLFGQILLVFLAGGVGYATLDPALKFTAEVAALMGLALVLLLPLLRHRLDMGMLLLTGVVCGVVFRSLQTLLARLVDPNAYAIAQSASFANFNAVRTDLLVMAAIMTLAAMVVAWRSRHLLDVIALGRDTATGLGIDWRKTVTWLLLLVSALVAVSTALVGPVAFLGLLATALAERLAGTQRHAILLPAAILTSIVLLIGGQTLFQHVFGQAAALGVVIEFVGGLVFLLLLLRGRK